MLWLTEESERGSLGDGSQDELPLPCARLVASLVGTLRA